MYNPDRVELVRKRLGLTKSGLAQRLGIDRKSIQRFESGKLEFPKRAMDRLCELSGYPSSFFLGQSPESPDPKGVSFRSLRSLTASKRDAAIAASSLAFEFDDWVSQKYKRPTHDLIQTNEATPAEAAAMIRARWGIGQRPIGNMINMLESHGLRVFSLAEETRHLDAYSLWRNDTPYIFLNTKKTTEHSRHDAFHELGHLVMHRHCGSMHPSAEDEANAFASAFLMPPEDLKAEIPWVRSFEQLVEKKKRWGVSVASLNYALHKLGKISDWNYRGNYIALGKLGRANEPSPMCPETSQIWTKILTDLWQQKIALKHIAEALHLPEHELNDLLFGIAGRIRPPHAPNGLHLVK